jgi:hypothetical protein
MPGVTVREKYEAMIREQLAPWFGEQGFKKRRNTFRRDGDRGWQVVDFQASQFGSRDCVHFTINLRIGVPEISRTKVRHAACGCRTSQRVGSRSVGCRSELAFRGRYERLASMTADG